MDFLRRTNENLRKRTLELKKAKKRGKRIIGYFPGDYVPEELIHAAGGEPVCFIHGGDPESADAALGLIPRFLCPFSRAQYGYRVLNEQPYYNLIDFIVAPITCQHLRRVADLWNYTTDVEIFRLGIPHEYDSEDGFNYFVDSLGRLKKKIEGVTGNEISDAGLKKSIDLYNRLRGLLKEISVLRRQKDPVISSLDFVKLNHASLLLDPQLMVEILESGLEELKQASPVPGNKVRMVLAGPCIANGDSKVLNIVEELNGEIVVEDICEGVRDYWTNVKPDGDLITNLAQRYLRDRHPCAYMRMVSQVRFERLEELVRDFKAEGVIWYQLKYCETYDFEAYYMVRKMDEAGIPFIKVESEYDVSDRGPLKTRIEAFTETLLERRG